MISKDDFWLALQSPPKNERFCYNCVHYVDDAHSPACKPCRKAEEDEIGNGYFYAQSENTRWKYDPNFDREYIL